MSEREDPKLKGGTTKKYQIICKFWMMNSCLKDDKCEYLHEKKDNLQSYQTAIVKECPWYSLGFCKNGPLCKFRHEKKTGETPELPIWFLEYIFEKPINMIYEDFERTNPEEVNEMKNRIFGDENFKRKFKHFKAHDNYAVKKNSIIENLNKKVRYFFVRCRNMNLIKYAMECNVLLLNRGHLIRFKEAKKSCDDVIFIIFDDETKNFYGYCKFRYDLEDSDYDLTDLMEQVRDFNIGNNAFIYVEWLWKTKLSDSKVELLRNPLNNDEVVIDSKDGQEIAIDIGYYMCRLMIKRLTKEEVQEYLSMREDDNSYNTKIININNMNIIKEKQNLNLKDDIGSLIYDEINKGSNSIIVTNISNLQVNISQNSYCENKDTVEKKKKKKRSRSRSRSKKKRRRKDEDSDSDATVVVTEKTIQRGKKCESPVKENKLFKNKLFSNAMRGVASSYLKDKHRQDK
jgi:hypothetical protein